MVQLQKKCVVDTEVMLILPVLYDLSLLPPLEHRLTRRKLHSTAHREVPLELAFHLGVSPLLNSRKTLFVIEI